MFKKLASDAVIYGGSTILVRLINYALTPLHTSVFAPNSYGIVSEFYAYAAIFNVLFTYGMETAYFRHSSGKAESTNEPANFNTIVTMVLGTSLLFGALLWLAAEPIAQGLGYPESGHFVRWFAILVATDAVLAVPFARLRLQNKAKTFASIKLVNILMVYGLNHFFLVVCPSVMAGEFLTGLQPVIAPWYDPSLGLGYAFLANLLANVLQFPLLWASFKSFRVTWQPDLALRFLAYGLPILFAGLAGALNEVADRLLLKYLLPTGFYPHLDNMGAVGVYAACYKLSIFITLAVQAFKYAAEPFFFARASEANAKQVYAIVMHYFVIACAVMLLAVCANLDWISRLFIRDARFLEGLPVVPILLLANVFLGMYYNFAVWYKVTDRTIYGLYISLIGAAITLLGNFWLIPFLGYMGSAWATLACYGMMLAACYYWGQRFFPVPYRLTPISAYLATAALLSYTMTVWDFGEPLPAFLLKNSILLLFMAVVVWLEGHRLKHLFTK